MDIGIEGYLYEPEKADYLNINQSASDRELTSESETVHNFRDQETIILCAAKRQNNSQTGRWGGNSLTVS